MIVSPEEISASSAPRTSPLKHCDTKLAQLITAPSAFCCNGRQPLLPASRTLARPMRERQGSGQSWPFSRVVDAGEGDRRPSGVVAELAAERVGRLHQPF